MEYIYKTKGTCSSKIRLDINDGVVTNVVYTGGCDGNLKAIPRLVDGMTVEQIEEKYHRRSSNSNNLTEIIVN